MKVKSFSNINDFKLYWRIFFRYFKRKLNKKKYTNNTFMSNLRIIRQVWRYYHSPKYFMTLQPHQDYVEKYGGDSVVLRNNSKVDIFLKGILR